MHTMFLISKSTYNNEAKIVITKTHTKKIKINKISTLMYVKPKLYEATFGFSFAKSLK